MPPPAVLPQIAPSLLPSSSSLDVRLLSRSASRRLSRLHSPQHQDSRRPHSLDACSDKSCIVLVDMTLLRAPCLWPAHWGLLGVVLLTVCLQPRAVRLLFLFAISGCGTLGCHSVSGLSTVAWSLNGVDKLSAFLSPCHCYSPQTCGHIPLCCRLSLWVLVVITRLRTFSLVFTHSYLDALPLG